MRVSPYFTLEEFEYSDTAKQNGIENIIPLELIPNIIRLHDNILHPLRKNLGHPVRITSGYRCSALNKIIGGSDNSQHKKGEATDIEVVGQSNLVVFNWIRKNCEFDQLILEQVGNAKWVHVSYRFGNNRKQCLRYDGRTYTSI